MKESNIFEDGTSYVYNNTFSKNDVSNDDKAQSMNQIHVNRVDIGR